MSNFVSFAAASLATLAASKPAQPSMVPVHGFADQQMHMLGHQHTTNSTPTICRRLCTFLLPYLRQASSRAWW
jgi:hypothetical protein